MLASGALGLLLVDGQARAEFTLGSAPYSSAASYLLVLIPLYIFIGVLFSNGGLATQVYRVASHLFRRLPGGLGVATVAACAGLGSVMGSSVATSATIGRVAISEMRAYGYRGTLAAGLVAAGGSLGALIPPSVAMVLYGMVSGESVGALLLAGIIPGIILGCIYSTYIIVQDFRDRARARARAASQAQARVRELVNVGAGSKHEQPAPNLASALDHVMEAASAASHRTRIPYESLAYVAVIFLIVIGGLYSGLFTVIEAGAIGAVVSLLIAAVLAKKNGQAIHKVIWSSLAETTSVTSMIFALLIGGLVLGAFFVSTRTPDRLSEWIIGLDLPPLLVVILMLAVLLPLGTALEETSLMLILIPIFHPVVVELGFDGVWFGILFLRMIQIAMISPPVGISCFVVAGIAKDLTVEQVFRGAFPFLLLDLVSIAIFIAFPGLVTFLPSLAAG